MERDCRQTYQRSRPTNQVLLDIIVGEIALAMYCIADFWMCLFAFNVRMAVCVHCSTVLLARWFMVEQYAHARLDTKSLRARGRERGTFYSSSDTTKSSSEDEDVAAAAETRARLAGLGSGLTSESKTMLTSSSSSSSEVSNATSTGLTRRT